MSAEIGDRMEQCRAILKEYDDGNSSVLMCEAQLTRVFMDPFLEEVEKWDGGWVRFGSCCCPAGGHAPERTFKVEFTIQPHGFTAKRCA